MIFKFASIVVGIRAPHVTVDAATEQKARESAAAIYDKYAMLPSDFQLLAAGKNLKSLVFAAP